MTPGLPNANVPFSDLLAEPVRNGVYKPKEHRGHGIKMVNMGQLFAFNFISGQEMERIELSDRELAKDTLRDGDLLFARRSLVLEGSGKCSLIVSPPEPTTFESSMIRARLDSTRADPLYYFYFFHSPTGRALMASIASRTAVSGIRGSDLVTLKVFRPPLPMQKKVASILSAYDDLIENNTRRIAILEEMAQALYREWVVNFRFPGHKDAQMVESEIGPIPERWQVKHLGDLAEERRRSVSPDLVSPDTPYVGLEHIPRNSIALLEWGRAADVQSTKFRFEPGEILFGKIRPYFHKVAVAPTGGVCSSDAIVISARDRRTFPLVLGTVSSHQFVEHATQTSNGTKMPRANWQVLAKFPVALPPGDLLGAFADIVNDCVTEIRTLIFANRNLRQTRDLLLPKLVSGEIDISDLDIRVPEAVE